jgi:hypothetical protein
LAVHRDDLRRTVLGKPRNSAHAEQNGYSEPSADASPDTGRALCSSRHVRPLSLTPNLREQLYSHVNILAITIVNAALLS